ncbi:glycosyltransferase family 2 protein [Flavobacterium sp. LPB0248]|uniref:glycosyltransferase family 2 protein n=1 Tax=Flavobacterium sp. LPB0248 TaxID=2614441 RepID=UPI0015A64921|nr:glycosyltransferase family A protein [Flavobacterium sp. LPB0248]QLC67511.1 glycosyltransferase family 2 protein [Flavobacterium sp. LPB0248]
MIIVYHQNNKVIEAVFKGESIPFSSKNIAFNLFEIAERYSEQLIIWCRLDLKPNLDTSKVEEIFHHKKIVASYSLSNPPFLSETIGYVDESLFLNVKKDVAYPTWQMSGEVGGIHAEVLNALKNDINKDSDFNYFLHSMAKLALVGGLLCYSEPLLVKDSSRIEEATKKNDFLTFRFVKQHYKTRWVFLLFLNLLIYEKKFSIFPFLSSFGFRQRHLNKDLLNDIKVQSTRKVIDKKTIDVIIPTIGRKKYLYDVLKDLSKQTHLPENVIIIEQNPDVNSVSELDYLNNESWPFVIKHSFTHQAGACNARNLALSEVTSEWIFMADDDIRIANDFLENALGLIKKEGAEQITFGCYELNYPEYKKEKQKIQWDNFGSGCSVVKANNIKAVFYNISFEFGYGEDSDFGAQLRNSGFDIIYAPKPEIIHVKAPIGGFRTKPVLTWQQDEIQPKPSPTVMLYKILNLKQNQLNGYQTVLFFKFYKDQNSKNPINYFLNFRKQWQVSLFWAKKIKQ